MAEDPGAEDLGTPAPSLRAPGTEKKSRRRRAAAGQGEGEEKEGRRGEGKKGERSLHGSFGAAPRHEDPGTKAGHHV